MWIMAAFPRGFCVYMYCMCCPQTGFTPTSRLDLHKEMDKSTLALPVLGLGPLMSNGR